MSNTKNLASLAAVLDDASSGQVLTSTGSGGVQFADSSGSGVTVHANQAAMLTDAASADEGTLHYETGTNKLYVKQTSGFYLLASITNASPTIDSFSENTGGAGANNLTAGGTFKLTSGSNTVITINATEPDLETISYSATVTSGTATDVFSSPSFPVTNQSSNVFTLTPVTSGTGGTVTIRFDASDGTNVANVSHSFEIAFQITDSHYTTLLMATDGSAGDNNDITDTPASGNTAKTPTVVGDIYAGTFSPYRHGGYSTYFDGNDYLAITKSTDLDLDTNNWTIECWLNLTNPSATQAVYSFGYETQTTRGCIIYLYGGNLHFAYSTNGSNNTDTSMGSHGIVASEWTHLSVVRNGNTITGYINGSALGTTINIGSSDIYYPSSGSVRIGGDGTNFVTGYISDFRLVNGTATAPASGGPTERLTAVTNTKLLACHLPYFADGSSSAHSITVSGDPETKPIGPYDYLQYDESINGGSLYFDGSDYLSLGTDSDFLIGNNDYSIEAWLYFKSSTFPQGWVNHQNSASTASAGQFLANFESSNSLVITDHTANRPKVTCTLPETLVTNTWYHVSINRYDSNTSFKVYLNGVEATNYTTSNGDGRFTNFSTQGTVVVGLVATPYYFTGYMADFRWLIGSSAYTTDGTPPTSPLSAITNTKLLLKGTDAHVIDKSQNYNLELVGTAAAVTNATNNSTISSTNAISLDGNSDYVKPNDVILPIVQNVDYTIEGWFYADTITGVHPIVSQYVSGNGGRFSILVENSVLKFFEGGNARRTISVNTGTWYHFLMCRSGTTHYAFMNGTLVGESWTSSTNIVNTNTLIGHFATTTNYYFDGFLQDIRIYIGKPRETSNFNVPSAPLKG